MAAMLCMLSLNLMKQCKLLLGLSQLANIRYVDKCWAKLKLASITASKMQIYNYKVNQHTLLSDPVAVLQVAPAKTHQSLMWMIWISWRVIQ